MAKIKFTSKRGEKPSKLQRACGEQRSSQIFYMCLYCTPKNICLRLKNCEDHRAAVNWVKEHAQALWEKYPFTAKLKKEEEQS